MKMLDINDFSGVNTKEKGFRPAMFLLNFFIKKCPKNNKIVITKNHLSKIFDVSEHTISNWIRALCKAKILKYKYSGIAFLNPYNFFQGTQSEFDKVEKEFKEFKSDVVL